MTQILPERLSYNSLSVFAVAARHENFSAAARELKITQAAVSRRISGLEAALGFNLFARVRKRVVLTTRGQILLKRVSASFEFLASSIAQLTESEPTESIAVSAPTSITYFWLESRLRAFTRDNPAISVRLENSDDLYRSAASDGSIAVFASLSGDAENAHWNMTRLFGEELVPMAAPAYLVSIGRPGVRQHIDHAEIARFDLIGYGRLNALWYTLDDWFSEHGVDPGGLRFPVVHSAYPTAVNSALRGEGVVLGSRNLLREHLAAGRLVEISSSVLTTGLAYYVGTPKSGRITLAAQQLADWLAAAG
jgi:DNA-binding transcriptional LysR family regulator